MYLCLFMKITNILISNFRNIKASRLITSSNINIIYGDNGCGKTSLLEAISYLSICRSFRGTNANYLIQNKEQEFVLNASIEENLDDLLIKSIVISFLNLETPTATGSRTRGVFVFFV